MTPSASPSSPPPVPVEGFDGPLDLLLDEVRRQNVAIENVSLAPVVARFLEYVRTARNRNLNLDIEWLHVAATLILWKSRSLLPSDGASQSQGDPIRDDLIRQLQAHKDQAAEELGRLRSAQETRFPRGADTGFAVSPPAEDSAEPRFLSVWDMIQQAREIGRWVGEHRQDLRYARETFGVERDDVTVAEMGEYLRGQFDSEGSRLDGLRLLGDQPIVSRRSCLFLAMLEMERDRELQIIQNESFGAILLNR